MTINSNNYEEFFLLYVDNELAAAQRAEVEAFAAAHPDLREELDALQQTKLPPATARSFEGKALLYKQGMPGLITAGNYETFFLLYMDNELPAEQRAAVERFVEEHPDKQQEWVLLQHAILQADDPVACPDKEGLYNIGKKPARIIPLAWMRVAAAVIITGGLLWMNAGNEDEPAGAVPQQIATVQPDARPGQNISTADPAINNKKEIYPEKATIVIDKDKQGTALDNKLNKTVAAKAVEKRSDPAQQIKLTAEVPSIPQENPVAAAAEPVQPRPAMESAPELRESVRKVADRSPVKPVILDAAAFNGDRDIVDARQKETEDIHYLSTNNDDKRSKSKFRGLFRKASRFIDRVTNAGTEDEKSIVRVASFEIVKK